MTNYREVWDEDNFKFSSDVKRLNHVNWDTYKKETLARRRNSLKAFIYSEIELISLGLCCCAILCITILLLRG